MDAASAVYDRTTQDVGNIVEFGHVNVRVPDQRLATLFYVSGLGLTRDPYLNVGVTNMWINVGTCQFHLPSGRAQVLRGVIGLVLPDLAALRRRLDTVRANLADTAFSVVEGDGFLDVTCPWGNHIRCHAPAERFGRVRLGMPYVEFDAPVGTAERIARFYREILGTPAEAGGKEGHRFARVPAGRGESLIYLETDRTMPEYDGNHVQIALADFSGPHRRLRERGLVTEESDASQYRFADIVDLDSGETLVTVEHEVRSMRHPMFARALVNRDPDIVPAHYATGYEAGIWAMPPAA